MQTYYLWIGALVILLLLDLWAINSVCRSDKPSGRKALWTAVIFLLPLVGLVLWGVIGPRGVTKGPTSPEHSKG
ncbi:PLD nuclease N-terminal domain-containing protein [Pseudomonas asplenii]|uniref:PLD nuclease N-terminal domain-containing protein n=1 Tax=Pseudomonas asplenii TaxID=53407 RepID=UPI000494E353|nr:PLD nuclease N-terminal domain-containing protein [Pseudomonas asplenii]UZE27197.1 PLD nuclease N-terminal domain-containing protein [Pseudomonas asplenii]